jgi:hypothetical protein
MINRNIIPIHNNYYNQDNYIIDKNEIKKIPGKECCLVCSVIVCYNLLFIGVMIGLIQDEDLNLNSTIF